MRIYPSLNCIFVFLKDIVLLNDYKINNSCSVLKYKLHVVENHDTYPEAHVPPKIKLIVFRRHPVGEKHHVD